MKVSDVAEPLLPGRWTSLPVTRWVSVQFSPTIGRQRVETIPIPLPCFQTFSEAHVSEREAAFGRHNPSIHRVEPSRAGVRFRTTGRSQTDTW